MSPRKVPENWGQVSEGSVLLIWGPLIWGLCWKCWNFLKIFQILQIDGRNTMYSITQVSTWQCSADGYTEQQDKHIPIIEHWACMPELKLKFLFKHNKVTPAFTLSDINSHSQLFPSSNSRRRYYFCFVLFCSVGVRVCMWLCMPVHVYVEVRGCC